jgi:protein phosphatase
MTVIRAFGITHRGAVRARNEDHVLMGSTILDAGSWSLAMENGHGQEEHGLVLAVADGIGGAEGGAVASRTALEQLREQLLAVPENGADVAGIIGAAGQRANRALLDIANRESALYGMGSTLCGLYLNPPGVQVFNCGDSRAYRLRNGFLKRLTEDHSEASEAVREGRLSAAEAGGSPLNHQLTNHLGMAGFRMVIEKGPDLRHGDVLLVCSDGLYDLVDEETIISLVDDSEALLETIGEALIQRAIANGGDDNISLVLARVEG